MFESDDPSSLALDQPVRQQQSSCKPRCNSIFIFIILGFIFLIVGMAQLITNYQEKTYSFELKSDGKRLTNPPNFVSFAEDSEAAIYINLPWLTQLNYANRHQGQNIEEFTPSADSCIHFRYNQQIKKNTSMVNTVLNPDQYALPCGRFPSLFYGNNISVSVDNISKFIDSSDLTIFDYSVNNFNPFIQWVDLTDQQFQTWMEQNSVIETTKLLGVMKGWFSGQFQIQLQLYEIWEQNPGSVWIYLTNNLALGGYDVPFCLINLCESTIVFLFALTVFLFQKITSGQIKDQGANKLNEIEDFTNEQTYSGKSDNL